MNLIIQTKDDKQIKITDFNKVICTSGETITETPVTDFEKLVLYSGQYTFVGKNTLIIDGEEIKFLNLLNS